MNILIDLLVGDHISEAVRGSLIDDVSLELSLENYTNAKNNEDKGNNSDNNSSDTNYLPNKTASTLLSQKYAKRMDLHNVPCLVSMKYT